MSLKALKKLYMKVSYFKKEVYFLSFLFILSLTVNTFFILYPERAKNLCLKTFKLQALEKLSRVEFSPEPKSPKFRVIKLKKKNKIYLDILVEKTDGSFEQTQFLELRGNQEASFEYWDESFSLFALDYDGDGKLDLGVPSFDSFLRPHFELLIYNEDTGKFALKKVKKEPKIKKRS